MKNTDYLIFNDSIIASFSDLVTFDKSNNAIFAESNCKNLKQLRDFVLSCTQLKEISYAKYKGKIYSVSDIYGMQPIKKQQKQILELWFLSSLKNSLPNLIIQTTEGKNELYFTIGTYSYDSILGVNHIRPLEKMEKLSYTEALELLTKKIMPL